MQNLEYDGSPRRFGVASTDDFEYYSNTHSNYKYSAAFNSPPPLQSSSIGVNGNYSSPSPPRPGFPQRISFDQPSQQSHHSKSIASSYSFDDQQILTPSPFASSTQQQQTTSTLIPTTFINNSSAYELLSSPTATTMLPPPTSSSSQEKTPHSTIEEEPEIIVDTLTLHHHEEKYDRNYHVQEEEDEDDEEEEEEEKRKISTISVPEMNSLEKMEKPQTETMIASTTNAFDITSPTENLPTSTFDYLYEFSETRKVLEEFFKCPDDKIKEFEKFSDFNESDDSLVSFFSPSLSLFYLTRHAC